MGTEYKAEFAGTAPTGKPADLGRKTTDSGYDQVSDPSGAKPTGKPTMGGKGQPEYNQESAGTLPNGGKVNLWDK